MLLSVLNPVLAQDSDMTANERQARRIFNQAYQQVFGEQGAKLHYDVNIIGIYKTSGTIWFKGKKKKFVDAKVNSWNDGETVYTVKKKKKKKEVEVRSAKNNKQDKYSGKFKFVPENFDYSVANDEEGLMLTLDSSLSCPCDNSIYCSPRCAGNAVLRFSDGDICNTATPVKCCIRYCCNTGWQHNLRECDAIGKCAVSERQEALRELNCLQTYTTGKCTVSDRLYGIRKLYAFHRGTAGKSTASDSCDF